MSSVVRHFDLAGGFGVASESSRIKKFALVSAGAILFLLFWDSVLPALAHLLILGLEVLEALMDHMLESVFGLDAWTAQLVTAWTGFFIGLKIAFVLARKLREVYRRVTARVLAWCDSHNLHL
ncbi:hypothetical protein [Methyloterricola oryzae]|uniref:hypothetical protein n=1 Tax=Methyloterricola oryzae TaxID=1495050 RepID=UPI0005EB8449|nr:hypothetical protein [Methyloterricola oryzae]